MKYRCPYCGEPAFTTAEKIGIPTAFGKFAAWYPTCPHCGEVARRRSALGWWCRLPLLLLLLAAVTIPSIRWAATSQHPYAGAVFAAAIALFVGGYIGIYCLFYFDKDSYEAEQDARFVLSVSGERRPSVKVGNISVCLFPQRNDTNGTQIIGIIHDIKKVSDTYRVTVRVICADHTELPAINERVRWISDSRYDMEGTVTAVTPKKEI